PSIIGALVATLLLAFIARASAVGDPVASGPAIDQDAVEPVAVHEIAGEPVAVGPVVGEPDAAELIGQPSGELTGQPAAESDGERMVLYRGDEQYGQPVTATSRPSSTSRTATAVDRRRFLMLSAGALAVGAAAFAGGRKLGGRFDAAASRARVMLPAALKPLAAIDPKAQLGVEGISPFFTPNGGFYRVDINLAVPNIAAETWSLRIHGMVDHELNLSYEELLKRKLVESDITLTCVSNEVGGSLLGTARWLGMRLDDLLAEAGIKAGADQVVGRSTDGYTCGFPVAALDGRDALVAIGMNVEPLPLAHGFPARLIVPGLYGYVSATKWLAEIELGRFDQLDQYWVQRGWVTDAPIKMSSRIDTPHGLSKVTAGTTVAIGGVAWAQPVGVSAVEVRIDDGGWMPAELGAKVNNTTWRQWKYAWAATAGRHTITVRAIDEKGAIQIEGRSEPFPSGSTGWHQIIVIGQ
ncbi:MAG: molybdopterin-dependent oxidoreductase, partial [Ilumatobacteraceae bacterium]